MSSVIISSTLQDKSKTDIFGSHFDEARLCKPLEASHEWTIMAKRAIDNYRSLEERSGMISCFFSTFYLTDMRRLLSASLGFKVATLPGKIFIEFFSEYMDNCERCTWRLFCPEIPGISQFCISV